MAIFQTSDDVELYYQDRGEGPALVLLHSFSTSGRVFDLQVLDLAGEYRVVTPDLRGCGRSGQPLGGNTVARNARDIVELLDHLGLARSVLLGSSLGGNIALRCALAAPDRVSGVITVGCPFDALEGQAAHPVFATFSVAVRAGRPAALENLASSQLGPRGGQALRTWLAGQLMDAGPFTERVMFDLAAEPLGSRLVDLGVRVEVFQGALDGNVPEAVARSALARLRNAHLTIFDDCAHLPHLENPQTFNSRLRDALERISNGA